MEKTMTTDFVNHNRYGLIIDQAACEILKSERSEGRIFEAVIKAMCLDDDTNTVLTALRGVLNELHLAVVEWVASDRPRDPYNYPDEASIEEGEKALKILHDLRRFAWADVRERSKKPAIKSLTPPRKGGAAR
jgi:hypothetical protein